MAEELADGGEIVRVPVGCDNLAEVSCIGNVIRFGLSEQRVEREEREVVDGIRVG